MATFFKEPYKKYYDKLSGSTSILASAQSGSLSNSVGRPKTNDNE